VYYKELLRRTHNTNKSFLPSGLLEAIRPSPEELDGSQGHVVENASTWDEFMSNAGSVVAKIVSSSDIVTPYKTDKSSVRPVMGTVDRFYSPDLDKTLPLPSNAPPFIVGVYRGEDKKDDAALHLFVKEMEELAFPENYEELETCPEMYACIFAHVADAVERSAMTGTLGHSGNLSCPRCLVVGTKKHSQWQIDKFPKPEDLAAVKNGMYFPDLDAPPRVDEDWAKYLGEKVLATEVSSS